MIFWLTDTKKLASVLMGLLVSSLLITSQARAQTSGGVDPIDEFNRGAQLAAGTQYQEAIDVWLKVLPSLPQENRPLAHKALGLAYKRLGQFTQAWHYLSLYAAVNDEPVVRAWLDELRVELAKDKIRIKIECLPGGGLISFLDSENEGLSRTHICPLDWWFIPGRVGISVSAEGYQPWTGSLEIAATGDKGLRQVVLDKLGAAPAHAAAAVGPPKKATVARSRTLETALLAGGAGLVLVGGVLGVLGYVKSEDLWDKYSDRKVYPDRRAAKDRYNHAFDDQVVPLQVSSYALYGLGGAAAATGLILWLVRPATSGATSGLLEVGPMPLEGGGGMTFSVGY